MEIIENMMIAAPDELCLFPSKKFFGIFFGAANNINQRKHPRIGPPNKAFRGFIHNICQFYPP
ncbi:hypothetical protein OUZ56_002341 [Daphnia magna]|uniref:Uncharacterized protein n=1 Tax=Daphnia magna TaxID=35525 RepID=A0ABR0A5D3_9CRUS|nr:hypothetical protein OUZ56_002341 [Daphnia magna]